MLGDRLRALREKKKMTQENVAKLLGITRPAYTQYESGVRKPDPDTLARLAEMYDVSIDYLVLGTEPDSDIPAEQADFLKWVEENLEGTFFYDFHKSPEEQKEEMMETLRMVWELEKKKRSRRIKQKEEGD